MASADAAPGTGPWQLRGSWRAAAPSLLPSVLLPVGLQGACELPSMGDAGPRGHFHGIFSTLGQGMGCCGAVGTPLVP